MTDGFFTVSSVAFEHIPDNKVNNSRKQGKEKNKQTGKKKRTSLHKTELYYGEKQKLTTCHFFFSDLFNKEYSSTPEKDSEFVDVHIRESNVSVNMTTANVTWKNAAWPNNIPEFFK